MVKSLWKKADTMDHQLQILVAQARKCKRDDLGPKQMVPGNEEQKQEWEANCEWVRLFRRSSLSSVDEETLYTMLADIRGLKNMCRTLHFREGGDDLDPSQETIVLTTADTVASSRLGHERSRSRSRAPAPSRRGRSKDAARK